MTGHAQRIADPGPTDASIAELAHVGVERLRGPLRDVNLVTILDSTAGLPLFAEFKQTELRSIAIAADGTTLYAAIPAQVLAVER